MLFREEAEDNDPHSTLSVLEIEQIMENTIEELPDQCKQPQRSLLLLRLQPHARNP